MMTEQTRRLLEAIKANPRGSLREWMKAAGFSSTSVIRYHLDILEREGKIRRQFGKARSVELVAGEDPEYWKGRALRAERWAAAWKASAKGWRAATAIECELFDDPPLVRSV